jgi:hypothetical protein
VLTYLIGGIKANTIAAIGTIAMGTSIVQYLFAPKIHHDLGGTPKMIIGNTSNKLGKFSCVAVNLASLKLFGCITQKKKVDAMMPYKSDFMSSNLVNTDWHNSGRCTWVKNHFRHGVPVKHLIVAYGCNLNLANLNSYCKLSSRTELKVSSIN